MKCKTNLFGKAFMVFLVFCTVFSLNCSRSGTNAQDVPIVQPGDSSLRLPELKPFTATYKNVNRKNEFLGMITTELKPGSVDAQPAFWWICSIETQKGTIVDSIAFDPNTLAPLYRSFPHSKKGYHFLKISGNKVDGKIKPPEQEQMQSLTIQFERPIFESSLLDFVLAALPLEKDYPVKFPYGNYSAKKLAWAFAKVKGKEQVASEEGETFDAWVVELEFSNGSKRALWIANRAPYRVKSAGGWNWQLVQTQVED
ncbi:hypothetical protein GWO43_23310 [candidate division KSB1 bacterium]|nr:hypothetical protein [candidate division KSB1 bacterium]NIR73011.1 hypothetical protein [candidate division KSB1 bacterium]NIS26915.1 hypothetical protein [candidate division KSB1 bacterium]NIT73748.1 hypothetical protein [candidate division KSB1 bacterium]NIU27653.1 hypothetical protein [candidate division KSB1 bacterium]